MRMVRIHAGAVRVGAKLVRADPWYGTDNTGGDFVKSLSCKEKADAEVHRCQPACNLRYTTHLFTRLSKRTCHKSCSKGDASSPPPRTSTPRWTSWWTTALLPPSAPTSRAR